MSDEKIKIYKNPERGKSEDIKAYVPQYQLKGIEPEHRNPLSVGHDASKVVPLPRDNPRAPKAIVKQPYAEAVPSPIGKGPVPNVGNNMEHTWSGVDGEIVDDVFGDLDPNHAMIDNNEIVNPAPSNTANVEINVEDEGESNISHFDINELLEGEMILLIKGSPICSGSIKAIEEKVSSILLGNDKTYNSIGIDDIIVLKRVKIKAGVFLE